MRNNDTFRTAALILLSAAVPLAAADLPVRTVILYKHGVAYFERAGSLNAGESVRLDFKAADMNDVLKSLVIADRSGGKVAGVRYDASETLEKRLQDFPFTPGQQVPLAALLDQMKGATLEVKLGSETVAGTIVSGRVLPGDKDHAERDIAMLLTADGEIRSIDLSAATSVKFQDPKLQQQLREYLAVLSGARSKDTRGVFIDSSGEGTRQLSASYMTPAAVWKSSYRLLFGPEAEPMLEGWAIVDNTTGEDWSNVKLSVVSGRPISFVTQLYEPRYVQRPGAELAENRAVGPTVFQGALSALATPPAAAPSPLARQEAAAGGGGGRGGGRGGNARDVAAAKSIGSPANAFDEVVSYGAASSSLASVASGQDVGELFEYDFSGPVTVKKGESAMLPFLQQRLNARKLLIYTDSMDQHPMNAAELLNTTGKTLDGGPITVYDNGSYAGEALVETLKTADKRLISYGVDLGTRVSTAWDSSRELVREIHLRRGTLIAKTAMQETKTYTVKNVDARAKTLVIEYPQRPGYVLLNQKPSEKTANAYRFEVKLAASGTEAFPVQEERVYDQTYSVSTATPDLFVTWIQNKSLSAAGKMQLEQIAQKKAEVASNDGALQQAQTDQRNLTEDQTRLRSNIDSLNRVAGQQDQVQQYARQLAASEARLATLRDTESQLRRKKTALQGELNTLIEKADF
jgi:Fe2+ transport system protein FeoA